MTSMDAMIFTDLEWNVTFSNEAADRLYGYAPGELLGSHVSLLNRQPALNEEVIGAIKDKGEWTGEVEQIRKDHSSFVADLSASMISDSHGEPLFQAHSCRRVGRETAAD